ncbi:hypothetical protein BC826DRAFT_970769 [Russula brevipes]|nr:hypothetical protein BC826DRAFT_970769 [Russula brevipes]
MSLGLSFPMKRRAGAVTVPDTCWSGGDMIVAGVPERSGDQDEKLKSPSSCHVHAFSCGCNIQQDLRSKAFFLLIKLLIFAGGGTEKNVDSLAEKAPTVEGQPLSSRKNSGWSRGWSVRVQSKRTPTGTLMNPTRTERNVPHKEGPGAYVHWHGCTLKVSIQCSAEADVNFTPARIARMAEVYNRSKKWVQVGYSTTESYR